MSADIVERLRDGVYGLNRIALCAEAADEITRLRTALAERAAVPEGWKLVPVEPTEAMFDAAEDTPGMRAVNNLLMVSQLRRGVAETFPGNGSPLQQAWDAMLAAAPQPPAERAAVPAWSGVKAPADTWAGDPVVDPPLTHAGYGGAVPAQPTDPLHDDAYLRAIALGFPQGDARRWTLCRIADRIEAALTAQPAAPSTPEGQT